MNFDAEIEEDCRQYLGYTRREARRRKAITDRNKEAQESKKQDLRLPPLQRTQSGLKPGQLNQIFGRMQQNR